MGRTCSVHVKVENAFVVTGKPQGMYHLVD